MESTHEVVNGHVTPVEPTDARAQIKPRRYILTAAEREFFMQMQELVQRMQGALQLLAFQQGMGNKEVRLERDCSALIEQ